MKKVDLEDIIKELQDLQIIKRKFAVFSKKHEKFSNLVEFIETIRNWFKEAGPIITKALLKNINTQASNLYRDLMDIKNVELFWLDDFEIEIRTPISITKYRNLSGGEQMAAALAVRLAILRIITNVKFAFFDEPTSNLDSEKRMNLSNCIQNIKGFEQLYLISHDDTFEENAENVIKFEKEEGQNSVVTQLTE